MIWVICKRWIHSSPKVGANNNFPRFFIAPAHCWAATHFHTHPPTGHTQATFTCLADLLPPVFRPGISLVGCSAGLLMLTCLHAEAWGQPMWISLSLIRISIIPAYDC
ncbi:hypothetical protein O181_084525 [Austropuccinia psidii MF-1]|uniref:Uncharacterized protein n=1 Tax=Austropuccinia psidii MF-1 TaxID=1389203 RepID=A0A9Q3IMI5_9BASI|nr:hypothetical protein [Austropuccinia psidii MF-1]